MTFLSRGSLGMCAALAALIAAADAGAHQLRVFASTEDGVIQGYAYFVGGSPARNAPVRIHDPGGALLGETKTDGDGEFRFEARKRVDHVITVDLADGHRDTYTVGAAELPEALGGVGERETKREERATDDGETTPEPWAAERQPDPDLMADAVARAVERQIRPLRDDLRRMEDQRQFRDIVGGIGYIVGLAGLYVLVRYRSKR